MRIDPKTPPTRCTSCRRSKERAIAEQSEKMILCDSKSGICEFTNQIQEIIQEKQTPQLVKFDISDNRFLEGDTIRVSWKTENCHQVSITQIGTVPEYGTNTLIATLQMKEVTIDLVSPFNKTLSHTERIRVYPKPDLTITECKDKILTGEEFAFQFQTSNAQSTQLKDENGFIIADLTNSLSYNSEPLNRNTKFTINVVGKYGGEISKEIPVQVFDPPAINLFKCDEVERFDTQPLTFEFNYENAGKAEIFIDNRLIKDVTGQESYTYQVRNDTYRVLTPKIEFVVTGETGKKIIRELPSEVRLFPPPAVLQTTVIPENVILFPEKIVLKYHTQFCEKVIISNGESEKEFSPVASITAHPKTNTTYSITPIGKNNFRGLTTQVNVEVVHPVEIKVSVNRQITLPHIPVKVTWEAKNCSQIILQPGDHDVTNQDSVEVVLEKRTEIRVLGLNKKDKKMSNTIVDVIPYPKFDLNILSILPRTDIKIHSLKLDFPDFGFGKFRIKSLTIEKKERKSINNSLSYIKSFFHKVNFSFQRLLRREMFNEIKKIKKAEK